MTLDHLDELTDEINSALLRDADANPAAYAITPTREEARKLAVAYIVGAWLESKL